MKNAIQFKEAQSTAKWTSGMSSLTAFKTGFFEQMLYGSIATPLFRGLFLSLVFIFGQANSYGQKGSSKKDLGITSQQAFSVKQLSNTAWNTSDGLLYKQVPGMNLGATSFQVMGASNAAFLSNASNQIIITDLVSGRVSTKFDVGIAPRDFIYENGKFYVLADFELDIYDTLGRLLQKVSYSRENVGVVQIVRYQNSTYLLLPNGNSLLIESNGLPVDNKEIEGNITSTGNRFITKMDGENSFTITAISAEGKTRQNTYKEEKKMAGVFIIGSVGDQLIIDVQTYVSESPISVERKIKSIKLNSAVLEMGAELKVPDMYYVLANKEFYIAESGALYNMITAPSGTFIFELREVAAKSKSITYYPTFISRQAYHFNDHLLQTEQN